MDGNKKIKLIVFAGITALAITACKVQSPGYVGLYIDNITSVNDTILPAEMQLNMADTAMNRVPDSTSVIVTEQPVFLKSAKEIYEISSDSVYQNEAEKWHLANTDSVQLLHYQILELQKQNSLMSDSSFAGEKLQPFQSTDSLQTTIDFRRLIQVKNDTIVAMGKQLKELQNFDTIKLDTTYVKGETVNSPVAESQQTDYLNRQLLRAKDDQIQMLQKQLNSAQNARSPRQTYIRSEPSKVQPANGQQNDQLALQLFQAQNDTIQNLRSQLRSTQPQQKVDSVYYEKESKEMPSAEELFDEQKVIEYKALQDTLQMLKKRVQSIEKQTLSVNDTPMPAKQGKTDTTLIVAFYKRGEIKPMQLESVLKQIKELCSNTNVAKITLAGYTDSSGNETINNKITIKRLNYLSEKISPWITKEKMFFQNFGDIFASDTMVSNERRIEITILTK